MSIFTTLEVVMHLVNLLVEYEPALEKDVKDILVIVDKIRNNIATTEGVK